jgi:ATP-dependent helicase/DNAse subunit B
MHKLFEILTTEHPMKFSYSDVELEAIVEEAKIKSEMELADERLWPPLRARHVQLARSFLNSEQDYRKDFRELKTIAREIDVRGFLRPETGEIISTEEPGALKFVGRIDRVDSDNLNNYAIHDYKSSRGSLKNHASWLKANQIQLPLYALAIENGLTQIESGQVVSATYYVAKDLSRDTGFRLVDVEQKLYEVGDKRKRYRIEQAQKEQLFAQSQALVKKAVDGILAGEFAPKPSDETLCQTCRWSAVCRAPHLNS